jgi:hypothetical protein
MCPNAFFLDFFSVVNFTRCDKGDKERGGAVWVCWVSSLGMLGERERERQRIDWVCGSSLGMLGEKE